MNLENHPDDPGAGSGSDAEPGSAAWRTFCRELEAVGTRILEPDFPPEPADRAEGLRHLLRLLTFAIQWAAEFGDPDFPAFLRTTDDAVMFGGPSADNRNLRARVDGHGTYRICGNIGTSFDVLFTATDGDMALGESGVSHERSGSDLIVAPDGSFELVVSATPHPGNWLPMGVSTRRIQVRQIFTAWESQEPGWFDIERIDRRETYPAALSLTRIAAMLGEISTWVAQSATYWNDYQHGITAAVAVNSVQRPIPQEGGAQSIRYGFGRWDLADDEALVVTFAPPPARYWSLQPYSIGWFEVLDYRNRQTTINNAQAVADDDGLIRIVISTADPGVANWIDTAGHRQGQLILRWIWVDDEDDADVGSVAPTCLVVPVSDVRPSASIDRAEVVRTRRSAVARRHRR